MGVNNEIGPTTADFFAGLGGNRLGFERAGFRCVCAYDIQKHSCKAYQEIHGDIPVLIKQISIRKVLDNPEAALPQFDVFMGGFPCQAFSLAGLMKGFSDIKGRGDLIFESFRVIKDRRPKVVFLENVKNLLSHDKGRTFKTIREGLELLGYNVFYQVLNGKDFGVAQNRQRLIMVAFRNDLGVDANDFQFPSPTVAVEQRIGAIMETEPVPLHYFLSKVALAGLRAHRARHEAAGHGFGMEIKGRDQLANTLTLGGMGRERNLVVDWESYEKRRGEIGFDMRNTEAIRYMTPREFGRLQGFPNELIARVTAPKTTAWRLWADSVPVPLVEAVAREIRSALERKGRWSNE